MKGVKDMTDRILVPLDGSALAEQALPCALALARGLPAGLDLLRTVWIPPDILEMLDESTVELNAIVAQLEAEASDYLGELAEQLEADGASTRHAVRRGPAAETILFRVAIAQSPGWMAGEWYLPVQDVFETAEADARSYLDSVAAPLAEEGLDVTTATATGPVANCIVDYAEANDVDFIAMCTHGRTGLARWALGSVADRVLRAGSTPILLVRAVRG